MNNLYTHLLQALLLIMLTQSVSYAAILQCSPQKGEATLNEIYALGASNFLEVKIFDPVYTSYSGWKILYCANNKSIGQCTTSVADVATTMTQENTHWFRQQNVAGLNNLNWNTRFTLLLVDSTNRPIDKVTVNNATFNDTINCSFYYDTTASTASNPKAIRRNPDGTGDWGDATGSGAGTVTTPGDSNDGNVSAVQVVADYRMDECYWDGTAGEVLDSSATPYHGTAYGDANTTVNAGGGVCYNGNFLSNYVQLPTLPHLNGSRTITAWFNTKDILSGTHQRIFADDENNNNGSYALSVGDPGVGRVRFYIRGLSTVSLDSASVVAKDTWYFAAATFNKDTMKKTLYIYNASGTLLNEVSQTVTGTVGTPSGSASLGGETINGETSNRFNGFLDEVKLFDGVLYRSEIETILNNEINGKNYDGTDRICGCIPVATAKNGNYNAIDLVGAGCNAQTHWNNTLSTKIVNNTINLSILAKDSATDLPLEANITKISLVHYANGDNSACSGASLSSVDVCTNCGQTDTAGCLSTSISNAFNSHASKCVEVLIQGKDKDDDAGTSISESNASDNFAIRPSLFNLTLSTPAPFYAGEAFDLTAYAKDFIGANTNQYDELQSSGSFVIEGTETRLDCITADENLTTSTANFTNGATASVNTVFSGLAEFLTLKIHEVLGSEFSLVDSDDTSNLLRLISPYELNISVLPYELNVTRTTINASTGMNWLYMADLNDMNITASAAVQANNKQHFKLNDFNASCYAKDVNVTFGMSTDGDSLLDMNYSAVHGTFSDGSTLKNAPLQDLNQSMTIPINGFINGEGNASMAFNVDRNFSKPINPFYVNGLSSHIATTGVALMQNDSSSDQNISLYYGRLRGNDIVTTISPASNPLFFEVYDNLGSNYTQGMNQTSLSWYVNNLHSGNNEGNITEASSSSNTLIDNVIGGFTFSYNPIASGVENLGIASTVPKATIHLKTQRWLWYAPSGFGSAYDDSAGSDCMMHPCFQYTFTTSNGARIIQSGDYNGTLIPDQNRSDYQRKGVKLFR